MEVELPFEFIIQGTPVSLQASSRSKRNWKERLERAVLAEFEGPIWLLDEPLKVNLYLFLDAEMEGDLDNIIKPILDSLEGNIFINDRCIAEIIIRKYEPGRLIDLADPSAKLLEAQLEGRPLLYVKVDRL